MSDHSFGYLYRNFSNIHSNFIQTNIAVVHIKTYQDKLPCVGNTGFLYVRLKLLSQYRKNYKWNKINESIWKNWISSLFHLCDSFSLSGETRDSYLCKPGVPAFCKNTPVEEAVSFSCPHRMSGSSLFSLSPGWHSFFVLKSGHPCALRFGFPKGLSKHSLVNSIFNLDSRKMARKNSMQKSE